MSEEEDVVWLAKAMADSERARESRDREWVSALEDQREAAADRRVEEYAWAGFARQALRTWGPGAEALKAADEMLAEFRARFRKLDEIASSRPEEQ